jgi:hypothetical protein
LHPLVAPDGFVGLRDHANQFMRGRAEQRAQCRHANFASADENDAHAVCYGIKTRGAMAR